MWMTTRWRVRGEERRDGLRTIEEEAREVVEQG
jgi:hypothetical protein